LLLHTFTGHLNLHSVPTRRSSDLRDRNPRARHGPVGKAHFVRSASGPEGHDTMRTALATTRTEQGTAEQGMALILIVDDSPTERSEEHTSELQSREKIVCRLLLEQ